MEVVADDLDIDVEDREEAMYEYGVGPKRTLWRNPRLYIVFAVLVVVVLAIIIPLAIVFGPKNGLPETVKLERMMQTLAEYEDIAVRNHNTRAANFAGYAESVQYTTRQVLAAGGFVDVEQPFNYTYWEQVKAPELRINGKALQSGADFQNMRYSGTGEVDQFLLFVAGTGCSDDNYNGFVATQHVPLIWRNDLKECSVQQKVARAIALGARAVLMYSGPEQVTGLFASGLSTGQDIPIFALPYRIGSVLASSAEPPAVSLSASNRVEPVASSNLIIETEEGNAGSVIVVGAHLDSVLAGPGINDNGSGSAALIELATALRELQLKVKNRIRFIWFGAEEQGLLGSSFYVASLPPEERARIGLMLNFDMLGSPNYFVGIYDGRSANTASGRIQEVMEEYCREQEIPFESTPFDGRSDYGPFIHPDVNVPAGGLFSGAEVRKTPEQALKYGGVANAAYDPCYHESCDTTENINQEGYLKMTQIAGAVLQYFAMQDDISVALQ